MSWLIDFFNQPVKNDSRRHDNIFGPLMRLSLPLLKDLLAILAKNILITLGLMTAASAT